MKLIAKDFSSLNSFHMLIFYIVMNNLFEIKYVGAFLAAGGAIPLDNNRTKSDKPYFEIFSSRNVSTVIDDTAILKCVVKNKGDRTVSWMRKRDLHILTSNNFLYTGDQRFSVLHPQDSDEWNLKIEYAQPKDAGVYECQVNTEPKINYAINLNIESLDEFGDKAESNFAASRARIIGSQELYIKKGSTISLTCTVNIYGSAISWYHGMEIVNFDSERGGVSLEQDKTESGTTSRLLLTKATFRDSGNYTCVPMGALSASVIVHVLNGEIPQAMQTSDAVHPSRSLIFILLLVLSTFFNFLSIHHITQIGDYSITQR